MTTQKKKNKKKKEKVKLLMDTPRMVVSPTPGAERCSLFFQIMYYVHHCGWKKTPMHIMNAESVHALGRGGKIVTQILNHEGLSLSYAALRRYQHDLAAFTAHHNKAAVALPCHFDPGQFTSGANDN